MWGLKARFHDLDNVLNAFPETQMVEFHLTQEDVLEGNLNGKIYDINYSIHLPEYWRQKLIDPCNLEDLKVNFDVYKRCIIKGLELKNKFSLADDKLKVIMHPGGATIDPILDDIHPIKFYKDSLYKRLKSIVEYLYMIPQFTDNIEILVENMPPYPWFYGGQYYSNIFCDIDEIITFCEKNNSKMCLDISHLGLYCNLMNYDILKEIKKIIPYTYQIHIADAKGINGEGVAIGEGDIKFDGVMNELKEINNNGVKLIPETMWGHKENYKEFRRVIDVCNQYL